MACWAMLKMPDIVAKNYAQYNNLVVINFVRWRGVGGKGLMAGLTDLRSCAWL